MRSSRASRRAGYSPPIGQEAPLDLAYRRAGGSAAAQRFVALVRRAAY